MCFTKPVSVGQKYSHINGVMSDDLGIFSMTMRSSIKKDSNTLMASDTFSPDSLGKQNARAASKLIITEGNTIFMKACLGFRLRRRRKLSIGNEFVPCPEVAKFTLVDDKFLSSHAPFCSIYVMVVPWLIKFNDLLP